MRLSRRSLARGHVAAAALSLCAGMALAQEPPTMSLAEALAYALDHNPNIAAAIARTRRASADVSLARSGAEPVVTVRGSGRWQGPLQEIHIPFPPPGHTIAINRAVQASVSAGVVWPLWTGGRVKAATDAARAQVNAEEADLQQATEQLLYEVGRAYYRVLGARRARAAAGAAARRAAEDLRTAQATRAAGALTGAGLAAARAAYRQAGQAVVAAANALADAEEHFNRLLGRELGQPVQLLGEPVALERVPQGEEARQVALATRPELLALAHRREAAQATIAQARAERRPTVSAVAEAMRMTPTDVIEGHQEFVGLEFSWPILNSAPRARERGARAAVQELDDIERDLKGLIAFQAAESGRRVADAREAAAAAEEALQAAQTAANEARASYQAGAATRRQLVSAEAALDEASARRAQADYQLSAALLSQARALGLMRALFLTPSEGGP